MTSSVQRYNKVSILLHWLVGFLIIGMLALGYFMSDLPKDAKTQVIDLFNLGLYSINYAEPISLRTFYFNLHKSLGVTALALILIRMFWRIKNPGPAFLDSMKAWEKKLADVTHRALYLLMLLVPVSGAVMASFSKFGILWFGVRVMNGIDNAGLRDAFKEVHETLASLLMILVVFHVVAAIKHKIIDKDEVMQRMSMHG